MNEAKFLEMLSALDLRIQQLEEIVRQLSNAQAQNEELRQKLVDAQIITYQPLEN